VDLQRRRNAETVKQPSRLLVIISLHHVRLLPPTFAQRKTHVYVATLYKKNLKQQTKNSLYTNVR